MTPRVTARHSHRPITRALAAGVLGLVCVLAGTARAQTPAGTAIDNVAHTTALATPSGDVLNATSNTVTTIVQQGTLVPPALAFFTGPDFVATTRVTPLAAPLYLQALAPQCDRDPFAPDTVHIQLSSRRTGDRKDAIAIETGPHTGIFRTSEGAPVTTEGSAVAVPNALRQSRNDHLFGVLQGCGAPIAVADVWVQPGGTVFDAHSGAPVAGARVRLIDVSGQGNGGFPGGLAHVRDFDGVTDAPAELVTSATGAFAFPYVDPSVYRLDVSPPEPWQYPSRVPYDQLAADRLVDRAGSYGGTFGIFDAGTPIAFDLPLDALLPVTLFAEKTASRTSVEAGDALEYTVRVANRSDSTLARVTVTDALPHGFAYVGGSARLTDTALGEPDGGKGEPLVFVLGAMAPRSETALTYRVRVGPDAKRGDALNSAVASSGATRSNVAVARVKVIADAFDDGAIVTGSVRLRGAAGTHTPVPDVRLVLDDGTWAITDADGRYSFAGVTPRTHALRLDPRTLPTHARAIASDRREQGTPGLRFIDATRGAMLRADFELAGDSLAERESGERRLALAAAMQPGANGAPRIADEAQRVLARGTDVLLAPRAIGDPRTLPAARTLTGERPALPLPDAAVPAHAPLAASAVAVAANTAPATPSIDALFPTLDSDLGFVGLDDLDTLATNSTNVLVKGPLGTPLTLRVNGRPLPESRIGRRFTAARNGLEAWEYVGVALKPGLNVLEVAPPQSVGRIALRLIAPGALGRVVLAAPHRLIADGRTTADVAIALADSNGVPFGARTLVTLRTSAGRLLADDLDPVQPGVQVAVENGRASFTVLAPAAAASLTVRAEMGALSAETRIECVPELRPLFAVGAAEGVVSLRGGSRSAAASAIGSTGFESRIDQFATADRAGVLGAAAHAALYVQGRVRDDLSLTLGYDSDRPSDERLFRDQQPDRGFPVAGDASARGYDAQSSGRLYARLERPDGALLYGDFVTLGGSDATRALGAYGRSLTGVSADWHGAGGAVRAFTSRDRSRRVIDELPGRGLSGPYVLSRTPIVENSERVEILVRDRNQPALVLRTEVKQRFVDYELEPLTGRLLFRSPVPSLDADLNRIAIRVTYEVEDGGAAAWVHGIDARWQAASKLAFGGTIVDDHDPASPYELRSASASARFSPRTALDVEWAASRHLLGASGDAERFELRHQGAQLEGRLYGVTTARGFDNPSAGFTSGRDEAGGRLVMRLADRTRVSAEALYSADAASGERRGGLLLALARTLNDAWRGEAGVRIAGGTRAQAPSEPTAIALRGKLTGQIPAHPEWSGYAEAEQDTREWNRRLAAIGGEYRFHARGRVYARHELASTLTSAYALTNSQQQLASVLGVDADVAGDAHVFSEYRRSDAITNSGAQAAVGLRNAWRLDDGMRLGASFERVSPLRGDASGASTALTGSVDFADDPRWKGSARMEVRTSRASDQFVQSMAAAAKLDSAWTMLGRHVLTVESQGNGGGQARERFQLASAFRGTGGFDALLRYEFHFDRTSGSANRDRRIANVIGANGTLERTRGWSPSLAWAGKLTREETPYAITAGGAQWLHGRLTRGIARDWDAGVQFSVLTGRKLTQRQSGLGAELGRRLPNGLWASLGWNRFGYTDDDLTAEEWTRTGAYLRVRVKFDESFVRRTMGVQP